MAGMEVADKSHRDGSPTSTNRYDAKKPINPSKFFKGTSNRISSECKSKETLRKMPSMEYVMNKEADQRGMSLSVVAKLMGIDNDQPPQGALLSSNRDCIERFAERASKTGMKATDNTNQGIINCKDVYEVPQWVASHHLHCCHSEKRSSIESMIGRKLDVARRTLVDSARLITEGKLLSTKEFQEALEVLSSNSNVFLKFLEEANSNVSKNRSTGLVHSQPKCITVLKPVRSVDDGSVKQTRRTDIKEGRGLAHRRSHSHEETHHQPTRIIILKPSPGKPDRTNAKLMQHRLLPDSTDRIGFDRSTKLPKDENFRHMQGTATQQEGSLSSSIYSNGYGGDESSVNNSDEERGSFGDSVASYPVLPNSRDNIMRHGPSYSGLYNGRRESYSPHSSLIIQEAKKRLSERWAMVACDEPNQEAMSTSTLGEMISLSRVRRAGGMEESVISSRSCEFEREMHQQVAFASVCRKCIEEGSCSSRNLSRAAANKMSGRKSLLKGKVPRFFFPGCKRLGNEQRSNTAAVQDEVHCNSFDAKSEFLPDQLPRAHLYSSTSPTSADAPKADISYSKIAFLETAEGSEFLLDDPDKQCREEVTALACNEATPTSVLEAARDDTSPHETGSSGTSHDKDCPHDPQVSSSMQEQADLQNAFPILRTEDKDSYNFVQKVISSSGLDTASPGTFFGGWHTHDKPLNSALLEEFLDQNEEPAESRDRRWDWRLLFDSVNAALLHIGDQISQSVLRRGRIHMRRTLDNRSHALAAEVWSVVSEMFKKDPEPVSGDDSARTVVDSLLKNKAAEGPGWRDPALSTAEELVGEIGEEALDALIGEAVALLGSA